MCHQLVNAFDGDRIIRPRKMPNCTTHWLKVCRAFQKYGCIWGGQPFHKLKSLRCRIPLANFLCLGTSKSMSVFLLNDFLLCKAVNQLIGCLLYTSPSPRDRQK